MKKSSLFFLIPVLILLLAAVPLSQKPIQTLILKSSGNGSETFKVETRLLGRGIPAVSAVPLTPQQQSEGRDILEKRDEDRLRTFGKSLGVSSIVIGVPAEGDTWPWYLGGGWKGLLHQPPPDSFDNLGTVDRFFLALATQTPPSPPFTTAAIPIDFPAPVPGKSVNKPVSLTATPPAPKGVLRVVILNGCGITNAADWLARRFKGPGIVVTGTGNADHFSYAQTSVQSSAGIPVALEEALARSGLSKAAVTQTTAAPAAVDVTVIVGKDFSRLKEQVRERRHH